MLQLPPPGAYQDTSSSSRPPLQPRGIPPKLELPPPGAYLDTYNAPPVPRGRAVAPLPLAARGLGVLAEDAFAQPALAPRMPNSARSGCLTARDSSCSGFLTARDSARESERAELSARTPSGRAVPSTPLTRAEWDEEDSDETGAEHAPDLRSEARDLERDLERDLDLPEDASPDLASGKAPGAAPAEPDLLERDRLNDADDGLLTVRCKIVKNGQFSAPLSARRRPGQSGAQGGARRAPPPRGPAGSSRAGAGAGAAAVPASRCSHQGTLSCAGLPILSHPHGAPGSARTSTIGSARASTTAARLREREEREAERAEMRALRAAQARRRLAEAEAALAVAGWAPKPPTRAPPVPRRASGAAPASFARRTPVERPEELEEARETMAALRAKRRRLTKELEALEAATGSVALTFGRQRHARTRLVTIRLVDERLAAEGRSFDHREVVRLAAAADLKHAEVLVWPGGLRVVFSEETVAIPPDAAASTATSAADGGDDPSASVVTSVAAAVSRLKAELSELHGQQMGFFLALLDARLGFDSATGASVQRQAEREHVHHQVPLPLSAPRAGLRNVTASFAYANGSTAAEDATSPDGGEASPEAWSAYAATPGGAVSGSVYSALARIFRESVEEGQVVQAELMEEQQELEEHALLDERALRDEHALLDEHALGEEHEQELPLRDRLRSVYA